MSPSISRHQSNGEKNAPPVSVLMAVYNEEENVQNAIESILDQTFSDFEFIIVDDGSTDRTPDLLHSFDDERMEVLHLDTNIGRAAARNRALERASGAFVAFMDGDDVSAPRRLETQLNFLEEHSVIDVCGTALETFGGEEEETWCPPTSPERIHAQLLFECPFFLPTSLVRRRVLDMHDIRFNPRFKDAEDYDFWVRTACRARLANLDEVLYRYRYDWEGRTTDRQKKKRESIQIQKRQLQTLDLEPSPRQFQLHSAACKPRGYVLQSQKDVMGFIRWMDRILSRNKTKDVYSQKALTETIERRLDEILAPVPGRHLGLLRCLNRKIVRRRLRRKVRRSAVTFLSL